MEKRIIYYIITLIAIVLGLFLNFIFINFLNLISFDYLSIILLIILGISFIPLFSLIYSFFIKNKAEEYKNKFYKIFIIVNSIMIGYNILIPFLSFIIILLIDGSFIS